MAEYSYISNLTVQQTMAKAVEETNGGKTSWLAAIAIALGKFQGQTAANMMKIVDKLEKNAADTAALGTDPDDKKAALARQNLAAEANVLNARLQGEAQMFKIQSETTSTVLKAIGEGQSTVARKQ